MKKYIRNIFKKNTTKLLLGLGGALIVLAIVGDIGGLQVFAQNDPSTGTGASSGSGIFGALGQGVGTIVSGLASLVLKLLAGIIWFVLYWIGDLMDNTFILEGDIGEKLRSVWVIVRNFVNIFFALVLVVAALMSVIGYGDESGNYAMKKFIPKMALALIAVNFTFLACRIVLDVNNVITTAIFSIPQSVTNLGDIAPTGTSGVKIFRKFKCLDSNVEYSDQEKKVDRLDQKYPGVINSLGGVCFAVEPTTDLNTTTVDPDGQQIVSLDSKQFSKKDFVWTMATQFQGLHQLNKVSQLTDKNFTNLTVNAIFSIIFAVIYGTAYVAMFIILLARMVVLWITIMLSPLVAVSIVIPDLLPEELNIQKKFLDHAFVPAKMAVPLSFGYILVSQMTLAIDTNMIQDKTIDLTSGEFARDISITSLMYGAASVAVIWMGVFAASKDVVGSELVGKIGDYVKGAGSTIAKWPTYLPILPVAGGVSLQTVMTGVETLKTTFAEDRRRRDETKVKDYLAGLDIMTDEIRGVADDIERKRQTGTMDASTLGGIRRMTDTPQLFDRTVRGLSTTTWRDAQSQATIAQAFGFAPTTTGFNEFQSMVQRTGGLNELRTRMTTAVTPTTPGGQTPNYDDALAGLRSTPGVSFAYNNATLSGAARELFGKAPTDDRSAGRTNFSDLDINGFMQRFSAPQINPGERRQIIRDNIPGFTAMSGVESFRNIAIIDPNFKRVLRTAFSSEPADAAFNQQLFQIYKTIFAAGRTDDAQIKREDGIAGTGL